ncbi:MAG: hypothetical protein Q9160_004056 [Pyrenula sp. 1 TL-2023]
MKHSLYEDFSYVHGLSDGKDVHEAGSFLAWHRYFLHIYEEALREDCGYRGHVTYWDWTLDWNDMLSAPVWGDNDFSFGTNGSAEAGIGRGVMHGSCVLDGPFANMTVHYFNRTMEEHCLSRGFSKEELRHKFQDWLRPAAIETLLLEPNYEDFNTKVEDTPHMAIPGIVQGDLAGFTAPNDPLFFLHHAQIDRLWWLWQRRSPGRLKQYGGTPYHDASPSEGKANFDNLLRMGGLAPDVRVSLMPVPHVRSVRLTGQRAPWTYFYERWSSIDGRRRFAMMNKIVLTKLLKVFDDVTDPPVIPNFSLPPLVYHRYPLLASNMTTTILLSLLSLSSLVLSLDFTQWRPPRPSDHRGPCPGLNSLANHGLLPRNGKYISGPLLQAVLKESLNIGEDLSTAFTQPAISTSDDPSQGVFNLDDLSKHNVLEHDASLSRADFALNSGDTHTFRRDIFDTVLKFFRGSKYVTTKAAAKARLHRFQVERSRNKDFIFGQTQTFASHSETALYLLTMVDPKTGLVPVEFVKILFEQERLPCKEGWRVPGNETNFQAIAFKISELAEAIEEDVPRIRAGREDVAELRPMLSWQA